MRNIKNINQEWFFHKGVTEIAAGLSESGESVSLPHTWNAKDGQDGGNDYFRGTCCYAKKMMRSELPAGEKCFLEINGANSSAKLYVNGTCLAEHDGGYSTWRTDITEVLQEENTICIFVDNAANETVYPQTADFTFYGGLYRDVNLIGLAAAHFELEENGGPGLHVTPVMEGADAKVSVKAFVKNKGAEDVVVYRIFDREGNEIAAQESCGEFVIRQAHLWDGVKDPYLYTAQAALYRGEEELDCVSARFGCRSFYVDPQKGFFLNGRSYPLRGVSRHQDRWEIGNALLPEHHKEDMDLICEVGANTIRLAHYQHDQYFYDLCDERGMVVWAEIPYISRHMADANENTHQQMKELITQCYNHPSICMWGLSNEITMDGAKDPDLIQNHRVLNDLVHSMDATRPTTIACISMCGMEEEYVHIPDLVSYNHYFGWYGGSLEEYGPWFDKFHEKYPNTPIGISEYGCEALNWHNSKPESGDYSEEYQAVYHESLIRQLFSREYIWATHVWNMFDFGADARAEGGENGQNHKGLITIDRKYKKDAFYAYKAWLSDEPFVHLCGKRYVDRVEDVTKITVYSNLPEVELFANGVSVGKKTAKDHFFYFEVANSGETRLEAVAGEHRDEGVIRKVDTMNPDYILREQGAVLNWFDIVEIEGRFSLNDKLGEIMKTFRGKLWFAGLFMTLAKKMSQNTPQSKDKDKKKKKKKAKNPEMNSGVMNMIGGFTVLRFTGMLGMRNVTFTKEELLKMNAQLNRIRKPAKK
ncbi:MAG: glycoside hydrolase family 2 protein [Lachnospiraceae bacterium]|nr:glycoside hydrolase family 2 protein [Lachnospiraceae bacterium]